MRALIVLLVSLSAGACLGGGSRRPATTPGGPASAGAAIENQLRGRWTLSSLETQGQARRASGELTFDEFDNITVRAEIDPGEPGVTPPRTVLLHFVAKAVVQSPSEMTYVGVQQRGSPDQMVPGGSDPSAWRHFSVNGDTLQIWLEDGGRRLGTLTFSRAQ